MSNPTNQRQIGRFRRYPALLFIVVAALLAAILPSALNLPQSPPSSLSEFAPVPGSGPGAGDVASLGSGASGGLGTGEGRQSVGGGVAAKNPEQSRVRLKRCVGRPARQTEDPRSPPCVPSWSGDNGGATARGVTRDEISVVVYLGYSNGRTRGYHDWSAPYRSDDPNEHRYGKAFARFFNDRYQTYGRFVRFVGYESDVVGNTEQKHRAEITKIAREKSPFAIVPMNFIESMSVAADEASQQGILAVSYAGYRRADYRKVAPFLIGFAPDLEDQAADGASFICTKIVGRRARFAPDPTLQSRTREFGILYDDNDQQPLYEQLKDLLISELKDRCGLSPKISVAIRGGVDQTTPISQLRAADVTTVITLIGSGLTNLASQSSGAQQWYPEWLLSGSTIEELGNDTPSSARLNNPAVWRGAFGITHDYRRDEVGKQPWYLAYREGCPDCTATTSPASRYYDQFALLFYGIQAAGPRLSAQSLDKGLHSIPDRGSRNPYQPAAYFAPGNYSFIKDAMSLWWDPSSSPPGDPNLGCYRIPSEGQRYRSNEWSGDDSEFFVQGPCQGPLA